MPKYTVVVQEWIESERGWGQRPDGVSLHMSLAERQTFIAAYWKDKPDRVSEIYSRPEGDPFTAEVPKKLAMAVAKSVHGTWLPDHDTWQSYLTATKSKGKKK